MVKRKTAKPKVHKPKAVRVVYVERKEESNPFGDVNKMVGTGMTAIVGLGMAGAIAKAFK